MAVWPQPSDNYVARKTRGFLPKQPKDF